MDIVPTITSLYFILVVCGLLGARCVPQLHRFFQHGKLRNSDENAGVPHILKVLANVTVPKAWFAHFYFLFWGLMMMQCIVFWQRTNSLALRLLWVLLTLQATRRSYESIFLTQWSTLSRMHVSHYLVGIVFYILIALNAFRGTKQLSGVKVLEWVPENDRLSIGTTIFLLCFVFASVDQYFNHRHLAGLKKYTAPTRGLFAVVSCAHYFDEIVIYGAVAGLLFVADPMSSQAMAFLSGWLFVVVNLSISAMETHEFYVMKFEGYTVPFNIIPLVY